MRGDGGASIGLSIVVPVLNEAPLLPWLVRGLRHLAPAAELLIVDGGSTDESATIAAEHGLRLLHSEGPGRARQMNLGAAAATGERLLFLHADTRLPPGFPALIERCLADPTVALGAFSFQLDRTSPALKLIELGARLRGRLVSLPYGDQGLFLRRDLFTNLGGYRRYPYLEDADLVDRARGLGRIAILPQPAVTSSRRWRERGVLRTTARNYRLGIGFKLGWRPPER